MVSDIINNAKDKMSKSISVLAEELGTMKAGRANPKILDKIEVEYYGSLTGLNQLANISVPEARIILIQPYDKTAIKEIEKAILKSDLGLNPSSDGAVIRLIIPELTEETRKELVKAVKKAGEDSKIAIRAIRRDANDKIKSLKKDGEITEDEVKSSEEKIQKQTDTFVTEVEKLVEQKEKEIMTV
ncbi:ribosome recycling factor [Hathewaya limosa]|uniref:Ribosome-recycling factor n=1 Tax=Hathewaya limosa TaxID=1536 RepID=A0ABU0JSS3_HATLI|nr:ribosome recycling factor [Hathewaya limosa]AWZ48677.1 ribosome recycling factor [Clostridiaceae bacterium 14S0207]MDQ0480120.1 ribosome recycling factor [Hathewaya limosa]